jgi:hypothetical protein
LKFWGFFGFFVVVVVVVFSLHVVFNWFFHFWESILSKKLKCFVPNLSESESFWVEALLLSYQRKEASQTFFFPFLFFSLKGLAVHDQNCHCHLKIPYV